MNIEYDDPFSDRNKNRTIPGGGLVGLCLCLSRVCVYIHARFDLVFFSSIFFFFFFFNYCQLDPMASTSFLTKSALPLPVPVPGVSISSSTNLVLRVGVVAPPQRGTTHIRGGIGRRSVLVAALGGGSNSSSSNKDAKKGGMPNSNYVVPLDKYSSSSCITRPLAEILRDLNKRIPDNIIIPDDSTLIPWFHANRMLSFYAPGWCGEIRDVIFSDNGSVTVVYRVTVRGSDGEAHRESTGTVSSSDGHIVDPVAAAEEIAFCRACARFGLGLYLYHEE